MNKIFGPKFNGYNFQESGNFFMDNIIYFHDIVLCILFFILFLVTWFLIKTLLYFGNHDYAYKLYTLKYDFKFVRYYIRKVWKAARALTLQPSPECTEFSYIISNYGLVKMDYMSKNVYLTYLDYFLVNNIEYRYYFYSDVRLEFVWTLFPSVVLLLLAIPSFGLLFSVEKVSAPELTVKVIGHQWYWEYQYMDYINVNEEIIADDVYFKYTNKTEDNYIVESYMIADEDLTPGQFRLLEVDKNLVLPVNTSIRLLITSDDVLHSWSVQSLGIKVDACPGRLNELVINIRDIGLYYGQCSELCGWYHGFMPIVIQSLAPEDFRFWAVANFMDVKYKILSEIIGDEKQIEEAIDSNNNTIVSEIVENVENMETDMVNGNNTDSIDNIVGDTDSIEGVSDSVVPTVTNIENDIEKVVESVVENSEVTNESAVGAVEANVEPAEIDVNNEDEVEIKLNIEDLEIVEESIINDKKNENE